MPDDDKNTLKVLLYVQPEKAEKQDKKSISPKALTEYLELGKSVILVASLVLVLVAVWLSLRFYLSVPDSSSVVFDSIQIADDLKKVGVTDQVAVDRIQLAINEVFAKSNSKRDKSVQSAVSEIKSINLEVPGGGHFPIYPVYKALHPESTGLSMDIWLKGKTVEVAVRGPNSPSGRSTFFFPFSKTLDNTEKLNAGEVNDKVSTLLHELGEKLVDIHAPYTLASYYYELGRYDDAKTQISEVLDQSTSNYEKSTCYELWALILSKTDEQERAIEKYDQAIHLDEDNAYAYHGRAWSYYLLGRRCADRSAEQLHFYEKAESSYKVAIRKNARQIKARSDYGILLRRLGRFEAAMDQYQWYLSSYPSDFQCMTNYADCMRYYAQDFRADTRLFVLPMQIYILIQWVSTEDLEMLSSMLTAEDLYRLFLLFDPYRAHMDSHPYKKQIEKYEILAERMYHDAMDVNPKYDDCYAGLGDLFMQRGQYDEARNAYVSAFHRAPEDVKPETLEKLREALEACGLPEDARERIIRKLVAEQATTPKK